MKNKKVYLLLNIGIAIVAVFASVFLMAGAFLRNKQPVLANELDPTTIGISFQLAKTSREARSLTADGYDYITPKQYISNTLPNQISNESFVMLENHKANEALSSQNISSLQNLYIAFGAPYSEVVNEDDEDFVYGDNGILVDITGIYATLNGTQIKPKQVISENVFINDDLGHQDVDYYFEHLDLTNIYDEQSDSKIENTEGRYTFTFNYNYLSPNQDGSPNQEYGWTTNATYTISFYLMSQSSYATSYPTFNNTAEHIGQTNQNVLQYFYNFNETSLPTITYDASLYNISFELSKDNQNYNTTSSLVINNNGTATLSYFTNNQLTATKELNVNPNGEYIEDLVLSELGIYEIAIKYNLYTDDGVLVLDHSTQLLPYDQNATITDEHDNTTNPYESDEYAKARYNLHVFGVKSYFIKNGEELPFETQSVRSDHSHLVDFKETAVGNNDVVRSGYYSTVAEEHENNFPITNLPPVFFDYFGEFSFSGTTSNSRIYRYQTLNDLLTKTPSNSMPATKDSQISESGFYEVVINYTYQNYPNNKQHYQLFVFQISSSTPGVQLKTTNNSTHSLGTDQTLQGQFTKKNVYGVWSSQTYFTSAITATLTHRGFNGNLISERNYTESQLINQTHNGQEQTLTPIISNQPNGVYSLKLFYSENPDLHVEWEYIVDNTNIQNINILGIEKNSNTNNPNFYVNNRLTDALNNKILINQPFTLVYDQKESGAKITTTYDKIPFTAFADGGKSINENHAIFKNYITTTSAINHTSTTTDLAYDLDYDMISGGDVSFANAFEDDLPFIYLFKIEDQAGNTATKFVIYDLTTPQVVIDEAPNNPYNIIYNDTTLTWGTHKAVPVLNSDLLQNTNPLFNQLIRENPNLFTEINVNGQTNYYLISPINYVHFDVLAKNDSQTYNPPTSEQTFVQFLADEQPNNKFSGEGSYNYTIRDSSFIQSSATIANNNSLRGNIWMNLDNSIAIAFGTSQFGSQASQQYGEALDWYKKSTNSEQLRVTYMPGEPNTDYEVKSFTYTYYEKQPELYTNINSATTSEYQADTEFGEPIPIYPYSTSPQIANQPVGHDPSITIQGDSIDRLVSNIINPEDVAGDTFTKEGFYVFRREYNQNLNDPDAYARDSVVRYYTMIVDREQNINIADSINYEYIEDEDIETVSQPESHNIIYQTGSGIYFKFTPDRADQTRLSARQMQQFVAQVAGQSLFDSNKLPVRLSLPAYKYNDWFVLNKAHDSTVQENYINNVLNQNNAPLYYKITMNLNDRQTTIVDTLTNNLPMMNNGISYDSDFVEVDINPITKAYNFDFKLEGEYYVDLYSTKSAELSQTNPNHLETQFSFSFVIKHSAPLGKMLIQSDIENDDSIIELNIKTDPNLPVVGFTSTNSKSLLFRFEENLDRFKAEIDQNNLEIVRTNKDGVPTTIYSRVNGTETISGQPASDVFSVSESASGRKTYDIDLSYYVNQPETYDFATYTATIRFIGDEADFLSDNTNFYERSFEVVVDRIKPVYNLQHLVELDNQNFNASNKPNLNSSNYFYPITSNFVFIKSPQHGLHLDSNEIFVRELDETNGYPTDYLASITPDDPNYANNTTGAPNFSESEDGNYRKFNYINENSEGINYYINANTMFTSNTTSYYEIVERDEAGNYSVYAVQYIADQISPSYSINYNEVNDDTPKEPVLLNDNNRIGEINGENLDISEIESADLFLKVVIENNGVKTVVYNNPNTSSQNNDFSNFKSDILNAIAFTNTPSKNGYSIKLTFVNRFAENYVLNYYIPGDVLEIEKRIVNINGTSTIEVSIPRHNQSTRIVRFWVWEFRDGRWSSTPENEQFEFNIESPPEDYLFNDSLGNPIINYSNGQSLYQENQKYYFENGEFRFVAVDNFGRFSSGNQDNPYTYEGVGVVNNVKTINYGKSAVVNNITYSTGPVALSYQTSLYQIKVFEVQINAQGETMQRTNIPTEELSNYYIYSQLNNQTGVRTLEFSLPHANSERHFEVELLLQRIDETTTYRFALNKTLPNIELRTLSGSIADPKNSPFTESVVVNWSNLALDFSPVVSMRHTYYGEDGRDVVVETPSIQNGYVISAPGNYTLTISNALGYTDNSKNITFTITETEVSIYGVEVDGKVLQPSPLTTTFTHSNGIDYYMEQYYILSKFKEVDNSKKIISNTSRKLDITLTTLTSQNSEVYKISGDGVLMFIEFIYVDEHPAGDNFIDLEIFQPVVDENNTILKDEHGNNLELEPIEELNSVITSTRPYININWNSFNLFEAHNGLQYHGNIIYADYMFNQQFIGTIDSVSQDNHKLKLSNAGVHQFRFYDLAGNIFTINGSEVLTINLINGVLFKVDNDEPLQNIIVNDKLELEILTTNPATNNRLYATDVILDAKLNGKTLALNQDYQYLNSTYIFTTQGYYEITMTTSVTVDGLPTKISTTYNFTIINSKQKQLAFDVPINYGFEIQQILYQNIEQFVENQNSLWLSSAINEIGAYVITLRAPVVSLNEFNQAQNNYQPTVQAYKQFSFMVDIHNKVPEIYASIPFGTSTTKNIVIDYNPLIIFNNIGESYIKITRSSQEQIILVNEESPNQLLQETLSVAGEYWVEILTKDGRIVASYKLTKTQPLNSVAIIIISISIVVVVSLTIVFIILRRRVKFR